MKKLLFILLIVGLAVSSCNKPEAVPLEQDVTFNATTFQTGFKSSVCDNDVAHYALITIQPKPTGASFIKTVDIFYLNGKMFTNSLKLAPGNYEVTSFTLMNKGPNNVINTGTGADDYIVYATPVVGSTYGTLLSAPLPMPFTVGAFRKNEVNLEVICFEPANFDLFGFSWFTFTQNTITSMFFFGDICTKYYADYAADPIYALQAPLSHDMIAIFKIQVLKQNPNLSYSEIGVYTNETTSLSGAPLIVPHPNTSVVGEKFKFVLYILVKKGDGFGWKWFKTWNITDGAKIPSGDDNVIDFVLGSCVPTADLVLPPYMNLPDEAIVSLTYPSTFAYWSMSLSGIGNGYDIKNTTTPIGAYCMDNTNYIGGTNTLDVRSSLYPALIPASFDTQKPILNNVNWLANNLYRYNGYIWKDVQDAVWLMLGQISSPTYTTPSGFAVQMKNDAMAFGNNYVPPVGGFAAVLFISQNATPQLRDLQLIFTLVDP